jgi:hypothetical protein
MNKSHHVAPFLVPLIVFATLLVPTQVEASDLAPDATMAQPAVGSLRSRLLCRTSIGSPSGSKSLVILEDSDYMCLYDELELFAAAIEQFVDANHR